MPRPRPFPGLPAATIVASACALGLAACGGGSGSAPPATVSAGSGCELDYSLTAAPELTGPDPLLGRQWHLRNTGQSGGTPGEDLRAIDAWGASRGDGVRVAVVDDAIEVLHPDLRPNVVEGASFSYRAGNRGTALPLPCVAAQDDHGTAVAGLVAARDDNGIGVTGVAPRARLVGFDALSTSLDADIADALSREREVNAVYNNSWGSFDNGRLQPAEPSFGVAIEQGLATGRGGRGSIFVFPGGNGGCYVVDGGAANGCQVDNSNFDGYVNRRGVIAVCAVDDDGRRPWYGEPGANLLVCAPSSGDRPQQVTTTALRGDYRSDFSGTSASTPMVSGVVALMLAANPALTWRDVRLILARTARRNDPGDAGWSGGPSGLSFNHRYGFGVADARAAVAAATGWESVGGSDTLRTCTLGPREPSVAVPDAPSSGPPTEVTDSGTLAGCDITRIEFVEVVATIPHTYSGDLRIRLTSPSGTVSELADARLCDGPGTDPCGRYDGWTFGSSRHLDEPAAGTWTLSVADRVPLDSGRLERWSLRIHGR